MRVYIGIDIGGTAIKYGIIDETGMLLHSSDAPTLPHAGDSLPERVRILIQSLRDECPDCAGIGISTAGIVHQQTGEILYANSNLPGYQGTNWKHELFDIGLPVAVQNDVNAAALAELWKGAGQSYRSFVCITVGTGIGGAVILDGKLYTGAHFCAGELGYMRINCGIYEQTGSASALVNRAKQELNDSGATGKSVFEKARTGDTAYKTLVDDWCRDLAAGMENIVYLLDPEVIIVGGGISKEGRYLTSRLISGIQNHVPPYFKDKISIVPATCGNAAGMIGAVYPLL